MNTPQAGHPDRRRIEPLWDRVDRNRYLLVFYLALLALLGGAWFALLYAAAAVGLALFFRNPSIAMALLGASASQWLLRLVAFGVVVTAFYEWRALTASERKILGRMKARLVPTGEHMDAKMAVKDMAIAAGLPVAPAFYLLDTTNVNALAIHPLGRRPSIAVTQGALDKLTIGQQRAIYANLLARIANGDARVSTAITAIVAPIHHWREARWRRQNDAIDREMISGLHEPSQPKESSLIIVLFGPLIVLLVEIIVATHRRSQLKAAEKADAEGMLLLKDPHEMLSALERCVWLDNVVPTAGESMSQLFYCWSGDSPDDETDPEWERVARLREVLGVEGAYDLTA